MIHIILLILKIIGFLLLGILGLLLTIFLIVLFVPFQYEFSGDFHGKPEAAGRIRWLFGALKATAYFRDNAFHAKASFLWFKLFDTHDVVTEEAAKRTADEALKESELSSEDIFEDIPPSAPVQKAAEKQAGHESLPEPEKKTVPAKQPPSESFLQKEEAGNPEREKEKSPGFFGRFTSFFQKLWQRISCQIKQLYEHWESLSRKKEWAEKFWNADFTQNSIAFMKKAFFSIIRHIRPKKLKGNIHFGLDRPSDTGKLLGYASILYGWYGSHLKLTPDFERSIFEGSVYFKGSLSLYIFLWWGLRGVLNKDIRKLIKYMKHIKNREETIWQ